MPTGERVIFLVPKGNTGKVESFAMVGPPP